MISTAYTLICSFFEGITYIYNILYTVLNVSCYLGYTVISFISSIYHYISTFFGSVWNVLKIIYFDFHKFLSENAQILVNIAIAINDLLNTFKNIILKSVSSLYTFYEDLITISIHLLSSLFDIIYNAFNYIGELLKLGKYSFIFTGTIVWNTVTSIPLHIKRTVVNFMLHIQHFFAEFAAFFQDVSLESLLGVAIASVLIYICILYRDVICKLSFDFSKLIIRLCSNAFFILLKLNFGFNFSFKYYKKFNRKKSSPQIDPNLEKLQRELLKEKEERVCVICREDNKNVIFLPCRHFCTCEHCCDVIINSTSTCPLCRQFIVRCINVYS